jgi:hypothetical protein
MLIFRKNRGGGEELGCNLGYNLVYKIAVRKPPSRPNFGRKSLELSPILY